MQVIGKMIFLMEKVSKLLKMKVYMKEIMFKELFMERV